MGSLEKRGLRRRKKYFVDSLVGFLIIRVFIEAELGDTSILHHVFLLLFILFLCIIMLFAVILVPFLS